MQEQIAGLKHTSYYFYFFKLTWKVMGFIMAFASICIMIPHFYSSSLHIAHCSYISYWPLPPNHVTIILFSYFSSPLSSLCPPHGSNFLWSLSNLMPYTYTHNNFLLFFLLFYCLAFLKGAHSLSKTYMCITYSFYF